MSRRPRPVTKAHAEASFARRSIEWRACSVCLRWVVGTRSLGHAEGGDDEVAEAVEEKLSLSDRFGLWIGFHNCSQDDYLAMVRGYAEHYGLGVSQETLDREALEWARGRGSRSGRVAWQFIQDLAGRLGAAL